MRVFACFLYFSSLKKNEITQVCVRLFYSLHIQQWMRNHWKRQRTVAVIPFSDVGILNPKIACALLSHHLVNSCRLAHNFPAAWSMGSKENGLIQVLLYHVPGPCLYYTYSLLHVCVRVCVCVCVWWILYADVMRGYVRWLDAISSSSGILLNVLPFRESIPVGNKG